MTEFIVDGTFLLAAQYFEGLGDFVEGAASIGHVFGQFVGVGKDAFFTIGLQDFGLGRSFWYGQYGVMAGCGEDV